MSPITAIPADILQQQNRALYDTLEANTMRLAEIRKEINELVEEAFSIAKYHDKGSASFGTWYAEIKMAVNEDHGWLGGSAYSLEEMELELIDDAAEAQTGLAV